MKGDRVPAAHHVARHCSPNQLDRDEHNNPIGPTYEVFIPDGDGVSVTWLEFFGNAREKCLQEVQHIINRTRSVRASHRLAIISCDDITSAGASASPSRILWIEHDPISGEPEVENLAHSLIIGLRAEDTTLMEELALACTLEPCKV